LKKAFTGLGLPQVVRSEQEAQQIREQRQQAEAQQQMASQLQGTLNE